MPFNPVPSKYHWYVKLMLHLHENAITIPSKSIVYPEKLCYCIKSKVTQFNKGYLVNNSIGTQRRWL